MRPPSGIFCVDAAWNSPKFVASKAARILTGSAAAFLLGDIFAYVQCKVAKCGLQSHFHTSNPPHTGDTSRPIARISAIVLNIAM